MVTIIIKVVGHLDGSYLEDISMALRIVLDL